MKKYFVYMYIDHDTGYPAYIGKGSGNRDVIHVKIASSGMESNFYNWMRSYFAKHDMWPKPFRFADCLSEEDAFELEKKSISYYGRKDISTGCLFNLTNGGEGWGHSPETNAKISARLKGKKLSPESIAKRTLSVIGSKRSQETRNRISIGNRGRKRSQETIAKHAAALRGRSLSSETRDKLSAALKGKPSWNKGRTIPPEVRLKMSISHQNRLPISEETRKKIVAASIKRERIKRLKKNIS